MKFARVIGNLVATRKTDGLVDATQQAGMDELVFVIASKEASFALPVEYVPVDAAVVGIVDDVDDRPLYNADSMAWKVFLKQAE
jgi:microcompartment protein CcmK/EutM